MLCKTFHTSATLLMLFCLTFVACKKDGPILSDGSDEETNGDFPPPIIGDGRLRTGNGTRPRMIAVNPSVTPMPNPRQHWTRFRDIDSAATSPYSNAPLKWSDDRNIVWQTNTPGRGASSPIIWKDRVFLTSYTGYSVESNGDGNKSELKHHVICLDRHTGKQLWNRSIQASDATQLMNNELMEHGYASSTPATDGQYVYAFFGPSGVFAFDLDGNLKWRANVGYKTHHFGSSASPIVFQNLVIVNASIESDTTFAFNKTTGEAVWKIEDVDFSFSTPVIARLDRRNFEMIINHKNFARGFNPLTGEELWRCKGIEDYVVPTPVVNNGIVYCSGGKQRKIFAIKLGGRGDVTETHKLWEHPLAANVSSAIFHNGHIYVVNTGRRLECINAENGELVKQVRSGADQQVYASPTLVGENMLIPTTDQGVLVFKATPELEHLHTNQFENFNNNFKASVVCSGHDLIIRNDQTVFCIGSNPAGSQSLPVSTVSDEVIAPVAHFDIGPDGRPKRYVQFMTNDLDKVLEIILLPYKSVITDEQKELSRKFVMDRKESYNSLTDRYQSAYWEFRQAGDNGDQSKLAATLSQLEKEMNELTGETRVDVKNLFSEEQMAQHLEEAKAWREKEAERLKKLDENEGTSKDNTD